MSLGNSLRAPKFLKATTLEGLSRFMLKNNIKYGREFKYFDIQKDGKFWIAWFAFDYFEADAIKEASQAPQGE